MKELFKRQFTFILYGIVFWLPVALVAYIAILFSVMPRRSGKRFWALLYPIGIYTPVWVLSFAY